MKSFDEWFDAMYEPDIMFNRKFVYDLSKAAYAAGLERAAVVADVYAEAWGWQIASDIRGEIK